MCFSTKYWCIKSLVFFSDIQYNASINRRVYIQILTGEAKLLDKIKQPQNRGYLISGIGALVALLAFLLLPYVAITIKTVASSSSTSVYSTTLTINATALTQSSDSGFGLLYHSFLVESQGVLWLLPILSLVALAVTGLLLFRDHPFGKAVNAPVANQRQWANYGLIAVAALGVIIQIVTIANLGSQIQNSINASNPSGGGSSSLTTVSTAGHIGFWFYLLGMAAVAAGAILLIVQANKQAHVMPAMNMSATPPAQPWQSPTPPNFNPNPYTQQYSTGSQQDWSQQAQTPPPYPAQQQPAYPAQQQWPPSSNQPQPPYSQGQ